MSDTQSSSDPPPVGLWSADPRFQAIADAAFDAIVTMNTAGQIVDWNRQAEKMFGWSRSEAIGQCVADLIMPQQYREQHLAGVHRFAETGRTKITDQRLELSAVRKNGKEFPVELTVTLVEFDGRTLFNAYIRDMSKQRRAERRIARQALETRLLQQASILSSTSDSFEEALRICVLNLGEITGWPLGHVFVRSDDGQRMESARIWHSDSSGRFQSFIEATERTSFERAEGLPGRIWESQEAVWITDVRADAKFIRRDGGQAPIASAFGFPIKMDADVVAVIEFFHTEQTVPDAHLMMLARGVGDQLGRVIERMRWQEERTRLAAIVESSGDAIIGKNPHGTIVSWNAGAERMYGWPMAEAIGNTISIILPEEMEVEEPEILEALQSGQRLEQFETQRQRRDGTLIDVSITVSPVTGRDGRVVGSATIERDITVRRKREEDLREARDAAEAANRARGEFLANVSHELRTPMNAILGMLELGLQEDLSSVMREYLRTAKDSADSLLLLVNEILDFSRLESGRFELDPAPFDLRELLDDTVKTLSLRAHEKGLELACRVDRRIPSRVVADPVRLRQIITNLAGNAIKFTEEGEVLVEVELDAQSDTPAADFGDTIELRFCVSDTGIGIAPEDQKRIFAPFTQADASTTREHSGTGLGLSICHELAAMMGGRLWLESVVGSGSKFYFTAELVVASENQADADRERVTVRGLRNLPVLVVDDNRTNQRILDETLTSWSMRPTVAGSAEEALQHLQSAVLQNTPFPLVIVDALMPQTDGFTLLEQARSQDLLESATILMLSSADRQVFSERCTNLDISAYLEKPVSQSDLLDAVMTALNGPHFEPVAVDRITKTNQPLKLLVAEDTPPNQKVIGAILNKRGHSVTIANNGREAVECLVNHDFDVVLMDVQMPTMDGLQATKAIRLMERATNQHIPIIAMTAHAMRGDREKCLAAGMDDYISKPINSAQLIHLVEQHGLKLTTITLSSSPLRPTSQQTAAEQTATDAIINMDNALARVGNDHALLLDMVSYFLEDFPGLMQRIRGHWNAGEADEFARCAHSLKGLCANFDADSTAAAAAAVEAIGRSGDLTQAEPAIGHLEAELNRLQSALTAWQTESGREPS